MAIRPSLRQSIRSIEVARRQHKSGSNPPLFEPPFSEQWLVEAPAREEPVILKLPPAQEGRDVQIVAVVDARRELRILLLAR